jgi:hypothetical protein
MDLLEGRDQLLEAFYATRLRKIIMTEASLKNNHPIAAIRLQPLQSEHGTELCHKTATTAI